MRKLDFSNWSTRDITTFIGDELEGSSWSISKYPGVSFKDVMAEALSRWGDELHIVTSADKKVLDAFAKCSDGDLEDYPLANNLGDAIETEVKRRESLKA
jgi:hypothetical protein